MKTVVYDVENISNLHRVRMIMYSALQSVVAFDGVHVPTWVLSSATRQRPA